MDSLVCLFIFSVIEDEINCMNVFAYCFWHLYYSKTLFIASVNN